MCSRNSDSQTTSHTDFSVYSGIRLPNIQIEGLEVDRVRYDARASIARKTF